MQPMRRQRQQLSKEETIEIFQRNTSGVLSLMGKEYPYGVPLSYVYDRGKIYFHCAKKGYKLELIAENERACFTVIDQDEIVPDEFTTYFRSAMAFGKVSVIEQLDERIEALRKLGEKYSPGPLLEKKMEQEIQRELPAVCMLSFIIEEMSGKEAVELVQVKDNQ